MYHGEIKKDLLVNYKMKTGIELIAEERQRQIEMEGWTKEHDSKYNNGELWRAAVCYASIIDRSNTKPPPLWPWSDKWWKPTPGNRVRELQKAGALIAAEIDNLLNPKHDTK